MRERERGGGGRDSLLPSSFKMEMVVDDRDSTMTMSASVVDKVSPNISECSRRSSGIIGTEKHWELALCWRESSVILNK